MCLDFCNDPLNRARHWVMTCLTDACLQRETPLDSFNTISTQKSMKYIGWLYGWLSNYHNRLTWLCGYLSSTLCYLSLLDILFICKMDILFPHGMLVSLGFTFNGSFGAIDKNFCPWCLSNWPTYFIGSFFQTTAKRPNYQVVEQCWYWYYIVH